jgi:hypothetical protein
MNELMKAFVLPVTALVLMNSLASAASQQIQNKTITASWSVTNTLVAPTGKTFTISVRHQRIIYVSSVGRIFVKSSFSGPRGGNSAELTPGATTAFGRARNVSLQNGRLVGVAELDGGRAGRMEIRFDQTLSSCTANVIVGRSAGKVIIQRRGMTLEVLSHSISGESCSIRDGNAFAM